MPTIRINTLAFFAVFVADFQYIPRVIANSVLQFCTVLEKKSMHFKRLIRVEKYFHSIDSSYLKILTIQSKLHIAQQMSIKIPWNCSPLAFAGVAFFATHFFVQSFRCICAYASEQNQNRKRRYVRDQCKRAFTVEMQYVETQIKPK